MQSWRRLIGGLAAMLCAVVFVSTAAARPPEKSEFSNVAFSNVLSGVCPFDVTVQSVINGFEIDYFDARGQHRQGPDSPGRTRHVHREREDADRDPVHVQPRHSDTQAAANVTEAAVATGLVEKIVLPDGSLFVSAGWVDFEDHPGVGFLLSPDRGNPGNVAGFSARPCHRKQIDDGTKRRGRPPSALARSGVEHPACAAARHPRDTRWRFLAVSAVRAAGSTPASFSLDPAL